MSENVPKDIQRKMLAPKSPSVIEIDESSAREKYRFISQDLPRTLIIPKSSPKQKKFLITEEKFENLVKAAKVKTAKDLEALKLKQEQMKERHKKEVEKRTLELEAWDLVRKKNEQLSKLDDEAKQKMEYLREKANEAVKEQNEEIKEINKLILSARVQAIRDAQIVDKKLAKNRNKLAEKVLDSVIEEGRLKGIQEEIDLQDKRKEASQKAAEKLQDQIKSNLEHKLVDEKRKVKEGELLLKKLQVEHQRDYQDMKVKQMRKEKYREELIKDNEEIARRKEEMKQEATREELKIAEYQKLKAAQEEAKIAAEKEAKQKREIELSKLGEQQGRSANIQAEQETLRAMRAHEEKERMYRLKAKQDAIKKKEMLKNLKKSRAEQLEHRESLRQMKERAEMEELDIRKQKIEQAERAEQQKVLKKKLGNLKYSEELKYQIRKKEVEKMNEKKALFDEGKHMQQEAKRQAEMLEVLKKEKLNELKKYNIPDTYINHIKKRVHLKE